MPHHNDDPIVPSAHSSHGGLMDFLVAGAPQLIPIGNSIIYDYFKSFPTVYMHEKTTYGWYGKDNVTDSDVAHQIAMGTAMWIGGQALIVDILLSGMAEAGSALPYLRALVCGLSLNGFSGLWNAVPHGKHYEWIPDLYWEDSGKTLGGLQSLLAFLIGFMGTRSNVGGGPWSTGGHIGLATASAMIGNPYLFLTGSDGTPPTYGFELKDYLMLIVGHVITMGGISKLLSTRVSPTALSVLVGVMNALFQHNKLQALLFPWILKNYPTNPDHGLKPLKPPTSGNRLGGPLIAYTAY